MTFSSLSPENKNYAFGLTKEILLSLSEFFRGRELFYGEVLPIDTVFKTITTVGISRVYCLSYCICKELETLIALEIKNDDSFGKKISIAMEQNIDMGVMNSDFPYTKVLYEYAKLRGQVAYRTNVSSSSIPIELRCLSLYHESYLFIKNFVVSVSPEWGKNVKSFSDGIYAYNVFLMRTFLYNSPSPFLFGELDWVEHLNFLGSEDKQILDTIDSGLIASGFERSDVDLFRLSLGDGAEYCIGNVRDDNTTIFPIIRQLFSDLRFKFERKNMTLVSASDVLHWVNTINIGDNRE